MVRTFLDKNQLILESFQYFQRTIERLISKVCSTDGLTLDSVMTEFNDADICRLSIELGVQN